MIKKLLIKNNPYHQTNKYHSKIYSLINLLEMVKIQSTALMIQRGEKSNNYSKCKK